MGAFVQGRQGRCCLLGGWEQGWLRPEGGTDWISWAAAPFMGPWLQKP